MEDLKDRVEFLENRLKEYDALIERLKAFARLTPTGRLILKVIGS